MTVRTGDRVTVTGEVLRATAHVNGIEVHVLVASDADIAPVQVEKPEDPAEDEEPA